MEDSASYHYHCSHTLLISFSLFPDGFSLLHTNSPSRLFYHNPFFLYTKFPKFFKQGCRFPAGRAAYCAPSEVLEKRRYLVKKRPCAAFELSTAVIFRGAKACLRRSTIRRSASRNTAQGSSYKLFFGDNSLLHKALQGL